MKFICTRSSYQGYGKNLQPCEEARQCGTNKLWTINISTLFELMEFIKKYEGKVVIHTPLSDSEFSGEIEIYDDYRE